jgi:radical SAM protein with 4Fe4S-binding SPASM domain
VSEQTARSREYQRRTNSALNLEEFAAGAIILRSRPQVLFVELTENCNLHCLMCRSAGKYDASKNMDRDLFHRIAEEIFPHAAIVDLRGWGESTILKDFLYYLEQTSRYGCRPRIVTNLTVGNEELWRRLVAHQAIIAISFDAATSETFARLRPGSRLPHILANLDVIADECRALGRTLDDIYFNVVAQAEALDELPRIVDLAAEYGLRRVHINPVTLSPSHPGHLSRHVDGVRRALGSLKERSQATGVEVTLGAALDETLAEPGAAAKRCTHPWVYCLVNHAGKVGFCDHLIGAGTGRYLLGDLRETSFDDIWNGPAYQDLRRQHVRWAEGLGERFEECNWCYRNRYIDFEDMTVPEYAELTVSCSRTPSHFTFPTERAESKPGKHLPILGPECRPPHRDRDRQRQDGREKLA